MSAQDNRRVAEQLFAHLSAGDVSATLALLHDDVSWRIAGKPELNPAAGVYDKNRLAKLFPGMLARTEAGLQMRITGMTAEAERVAVEVVSYGKLKNGRVYEQEYHFLLEFREGRICAVREYLDTQHSHAVWIVR